MSRVLIIGRHDDPHTLSVSSEILALAHHAVCIDSTRGDCLTVLVGNDQCQVRYKSTEDDREGDAVFDSIWLRQKPTVPLAWWSPLQHDAARFAQSEWRAVIHSLDAYLPHAYWINHPAVHQAINHKPEQLLLAKQLGFKIPDTAITNDPDVVGELLNKHGKVIYKSMSGYIFTDQTGILTSIVTDNALLNGRESIKRAPGIYQEFVAKAFEARVTVVGETTFTSYVRTPETGLGQVDWRHSHFEDIFAEGELPDSVKQLIFQFQRHVGLQYGAYDFVISPDGDWYFLECNPTGQFLWLEHQLGFKISKAIAEQLCNRASSSHSQR